MHNLIDLKVSFLAGLFFAIAFTDFEIIMKVIAFVLTAGYTLRRWYLLEKNKKE